MSKRSTATRFTFVPTTTILPPVQGSEFAGHYEYESERSMPAEELYDSGRATGRFLFVNLGPFDDNEAIGFLSAGNTISADWRTFTAYSENSEMESDEEAEAFYQAQLGKARAAMITDFVAWNPGEPNFYEVRFNLLGMVNVAAKDASEARELARKIVAENDPHSGIQLCLDDIEIDSVEYMGG